jgi:hypothetical protein
MKNFVEKCTVRFSGKSTFTPIYNPGTMIKQSLFVIFMMMLE